MPHTFENDRINIRKDRRGHYWLVVSRDGRNITAIQEEAILWINFDHDDEREWVVLGLHSQGRITPLKTINVTHATWNEVMG